MPLFVNQSAVSERENSENPQREEDDGGTGGVNIRGGYLQLLQRIAQLLRSAVPGGPRIASSCRGQNQKNLEIMWLELLNTGAGETITFFKKATRGNSKAQRGGKRKTFYLGCHEERRR